MNNKPTKIIYSIWFITFIISIVIFLFSYKNFKEYSVTKIEEEGKDYNDYKFFFDFDCDSIDENINIKNINTINSKEVIITNNNNKIIHTGVTTPFKIPDFFTEPFCINKKTDTPNNMLYLIQMHDKIYLASNRFDTLLEQTFLDTIYSKGEYINVPNYFDYGYLGTYDVNNDGHPEIFLYIAEGYRIFPRKLYCVDYYHNKLLHTSVQFGAFPINYKKYTIGDEPYFVIGSQATGNMLDFKDVYLPDSASYFMVFDKSLHLKFEPIVMGKTSSRVYFFLKKIDNKPYFFVLSNPFDESLNTTIKQIDLQGNIIKEYTLPNVLKAIFGGIFNINNDIFYIDKDFKYHKFNILNKEDEILKLNFIEQPFWLLSEDIDKDGNIEHFFRDKSSNKIIITKDDFSKAASFELPLNEINNARFYFPRTADKKHLIFVWTYTKYYTFEYIKDKYYLLKIIGLFFSIFSVIFAIIFIIQLAVKHQLKEKQQVTSRIKELEFYNVRNQMNPHFTLNTLNFISTSILKNEKDKAYDVISGFSNIIRSTLLDANKILRNLNEEITFVSDYLKIQKARFGDKFDYEINTNNVDLNNVKIPPFIIQIFVENSLKHGIKELKTGGLIKISIKDNEKHVIIEIEDNGIGRKQAKSRHSANSTGKGLILTKEYIDLINSFNKEKITLNFIDKKDNENGLTVRITIPYSIHS